jgi:hypothetical protein
VTDREEAEDIAAAFSKWKCDVCGGPMYGTPFSKRQPEVMLMRCVCCERTAPRVEEHAEGCFCASCLR